MKSIYTANIKTLLFFFFMAMPFTLYAVPTDVSAEKQTFSIKALQDDFSQLYRDLQLAHYNVYANLSKPIYDRAFEAYFRGIDKPMTAIQAQVYFQQFVALGDIAHANIDLPIQDFIAYRSNGGKALPLYIKIDDNCVWVDKFFGEEQGIERFTAIHAINGKPMTEWLEQLSRFISADNDRLTNTLIERLFPLLLWLDDADSDNFQLTLGNESTPTVITVKTITSEEQSLAIEKQPSADIINSDSREAKMLENSIAYLRPGPFYNNEPNTKNIWDNTAFTDFIDNAFDDFNQNGAQALIVDLRSNPGGTNSFSDHLIAWFATEPFKFASRFEVKVSPQAEKANAERLKLSVDDTDVSHQLANFYHQSKSGEVFTFDLPLSQPHGDKQFKAPVYILVNRYSYSNAVSVAAIVQDYGFGKIIGEKTADLATTFGAMEKFKLSNTAIEVGFPKALIIRPNGDESPDGVTPDYVIPMPFGLDSEVKQLEQAVDLILIQLED